MITSYIVQVILYLSLISNILYEDTLVKLEGCRILNKIVLNKFTIYLVKESISQMFLLIVENDVNIRATLEDSSASRTQRLARNAVVQLINIRNEKDRGGKGAFFPCTSTTHIKSMLFIHVIIAYYTFAAAGHEAPLSPLFSLKKYLNLKKSRWLRSEKVREELSVNWINEW